MAQLRRKLEQKKNLPTKTKVKVPDKKLLFSYTPKLIKKDLRKTLLISLIFIILIFILKFFPLLELIFHQ
jgi:hypothetical protein